MIIEILDRIGVIIGCVMLYLVACWMMPFIAYAYSMPSNPAVKSYLIGVSAVHFFVWGMWSISKVSTKGS